MADHNELGQQGEALAEQHLFKKGYRILHRNWRWQRAELDIVAQKGDLLVVVEVKTRNSSYFGGIESAVSRSKQRQVVKATHGYLLEHGLDLEVRFDIIFVVLNAHTSELQHLEGAFRPEW